MNLKKFIKKIIPKSVLNLRHLFYALCGCVIFRNPSKKLIVIGITGTSGKSSTVYLLKQLLETAGFKVGALSTIEFCVAGDCKLNNKKMTMLGKMEIQKYLRKMLSNGCDVVIIETTSEGSVQYRHKFINYDMIMLTNLYPEHIESHGSFKNYKRAKLNIFRHVSKGRQKRLQLPSVIARELKRPSQSRCLESDSRDCDGSNEPRNDSSIPKTCFVNAQSEYAQEFLSFKFQNKITFGKGGNFFPDNISVDKDGLHFSIDGNGFDADMFGEHNIMNITSAIAVAKTLGVDWDTIKKAVSNFENIPGRLEFIPEAKKSGFQIIVDYAFEPVAIKELYKVVKLLKPRKVVHVFGATGGGRDKERRQTVGEFVGKNADICIITNEDPYDDDPMEIINDVASAVEKTGKKTGENLFKVLDRGKAIKKAVDLAQNDDLILVTGKGSEQAIIVKGALVPWDDREEVKKALKF